MLTYVNTPLTRWESQPSLAQVCSLTSTNLGITGWEEDLGGSLSAAEGFLPSRDDQKTEQDG